MAKSFLRTFDSVDLYEFVKFLKQISKPFAAVVLSALFMCVSCGQSLELVQRVFEIKINFLECILIIPLKPKLI